MLATRRVVVGAGERRRAALEERLRPLALALVEGERVSNGVPAGASTTFALLLGRYARSLSGEPRRRIASFFEETGGVNSASERLRSRSASSRAEAAFALGDMGSQRAIPALLEALEDSDRDVRAAAARSLARLGATKAVEPLLGALAAGTLPRAIVGASLLELGAPATPGLRLLVDHPDPARRATAVQLLGLLGRGVRRASLAGAAARHRGRRAGAGGARARTAGGE